MAFTLGPPLSVILQCVVAAIAGAVMGARLWLRKHRCQPFDISDYVTMLCIFSLVVTTVMVSVVGQYNVSGVLQKPGGPSPHDLVIAKRITHVYVGYTYGYFIYFWGQKAVVLLFIQRVWGGLPWPRIWIMVAWGWLALTFTFAVVGWSVSCAGPVHNILLTGHPPVNCLNAKGSLYSYVVQNTSSDLILIILPIPWVVQVHRPWSQRLLLIGLFSLGILVAAASLSRAFFPTSNPGINIIITLFEVLLSALAANLPTMYTLRRRKPRAPSTPDPECSMPQQHPPPLCPRPRILTDTQIIADSGDTDTETPSDHRNTRVSSQASTEPLFRRELNL